MASLAKRFDGNVVLATGDKDLLACCTADGRLRVHLFRHKGEQLVDAQGVEQILGVRHDQVTDRGRVSPPQPVLRGRSLSEAKDEAELRLSASRGVRPGLHWRDPLWLTKRFRERQTQHRRAAAGRVGEFLARAGRGG
jgi:hypothetical protein